MKVSVRWKYVVKHAHRTEKGCTNSARRKIVSLTCQMAVNFPPAQRSRSKPSAANRVHAKYSCAGGTNEQTYQKRRTSFVSTIRCFRIVNKTRVAAVLVSSVVYFDACFSEPLTFRVRMMNTHNLFFELMLYHVERCSSETEVKKSMSLPKSEEQTKNVGETRTHTRRGSAHVLSDVSSICSCIVKKPHESVHDLCFLGGTQRSVN
jgi:hypothetical protein